MNRNDLMNMDHAQLLAQRVKIYQQNALKSAIFNLAIGAVGTIVFFVYYGKLGDNDWDCYANADSDVASDTSFGLASYHNVSERYATILLVGGLFYLFEILQGVISIFAIKNITAA